MKLYRLKRVQHIPVSVDEAWRFFAHPSNLPLITPPWLEFRIKGYVPDKMYAGMLIAYHHKPFLGLPVTWISEISHIREPDFFVDEQRYGPYRFWRHQHFFETTTNGTEMTDLVHYGLKFGTLGRLIHRLTVRPKLENIFDYRRQRIERIFGREDGPG